MYYHAKNISDGIKVYCDYGSRGGLPRKITTEIRDLDLDASSNTLYTESSKAKHLTFTKHSEFYEFVTRMNTCTVDVSITFVSFFKVCAVNCVQFVFRVPIERKFHFVQSFQLESCSVLYFLFA
jgi:hypothetical protein